MVPFSFAGEEFALVDGRALYWPRESALLVADLHLEKASYYATRGQMLPPYDSRATLAALAALVGRFAPRQVIVLGDTLHDRGALGRMDPADLAALRALQAGRDWIWLSGNHDPEPPAALGGTVRAEWLLDGIVLRHAPSQDETRPEIAGHLHPAGKVRGRGRAVRRRCFAASESPSHSTRSGRGRPAATRPAAPRHSPARAPAGWPA